MNFAKLPIGFAMALPQNTPALERFGRMSEPERQKVISQTRDARSEGEMQKSFPESQTEQNNSQGAVLLAAP